MNGILDLSIITGLVYNWTTEVEGVGALCFWANLSGLWKISPRWFYEALRFDDKWVEINSYYVFFPPAPAVDSFLFFFSTPRQCRQLLVPSAAQCLIYFYILTHRRAWLTEASTHYNKRKLESSSKKLDRVTRKTPKSQPIWYNCLSLSDGPRWKSWYKHFRN